MTAKQSGLYASNGSKYGVVTDGAGTLAGATSHTSATPKQSSGAQAPDGSIYFTLTNGSGSLA